MVHGLFGGGHSGGHFHLHNSHHHHHHHSHPNIGAGYVPIAFIPYHSSIHTISTTHDPELIPSPPNALVALNFSYNGKGFPLQYSIPFEAEGFITLEELNDFIESVNVVYMKDRPKEFYLTAFQLIMGAIGVFFFKYFIEGEEGDPLFMVILMGLGLGFLTSKFLLSLYFRCYLNSHLQRNVTNFIRTENERLFISRGCHWEDSVSNLDDRLYSLYLLSHQNLSPVVSATIPSVHLTTAVAIPAIPSSTIDDSIPVAVVEPMSNENKERRTTDNLNIDV